MKHARALLLVALVALAASLCPQPEPVAELDGTTAANDDDAQADTIPDSDWYTNR